MQSVFESFCRCFGTPGMNNTDVMMENYSAAAAAAAAAAEEHNSGNSQQRRGAVSPTPDIKKRTRRLTLQDKQWDALFEGACRSTPLSTPNVNLNSANSIVSNTPYVVTTSSSGNKQSSSRKAPPRRNKSDPQVLEQAHALAKAKLAANNPPTLLNHKRKRSGASDIFRLKKPDSNPAVSAAAAGAATAGAAAAAAFTPFSRFLSSHPVFAQSLCFATPIKDSRDDAEPETIPFDGNNSVVSDTNTLNTAEDTITSTLYYEQVKLAGLKQKNPPMPLFNQFAVSTGDDIRRIVATDSHNSMRMLDIMRQQQEMERKRKAMTESQPRTGPEEFQVVNLDDSEEEDDIVYMDEVRNKSERQQPSHTYTTQDATPPTTPGAKRGSDVFMTEANITPESSGEPLPEVTRCSGSSHSTRSSHSFRRATQKSKAKI